jgi:hypothetical protein
MRTLSSPSTFTAKFISPMVLNTGLGAVVASLWVPHMWSDATGHGPVPTWVRAACVVVWVLLTAGSVWIAVRIKAVRLDGDVLVISNFRREIRVPLTDLLSVSYWSATNPQVVSLTLRADTPFGRRILFMPDRRWTISFFEPPIVKELQTLSVS